MRKIVLSILVLSILTASALGGCGETSTLTILSIAEGNVLVMKAGTGNWVEAQVGMTLEPGDVIRTGDGSNAQITFFEGSTIELRAGTEIEVVALGVARDTGSTTIRLGQTIGRTILRVTKMIDPASRYEVETPTGLVAVRGSAVEIYVIEDGTSLITNIAGDIRAIAQGVELQVPEGRQCLIRPDQPPELMVEVTFADPNLEAAIRRAIGKPEGPIYASDLDGLSVLDATERNITDLTGLEYSTSLGYLLLNSNQISDISPLASLMNLTVLTISDNQISDISPLANLTGLTALRLDGNQISDISPLANLIGMIGLNLEYNQISDISPLVNLTGLTGLGLRYNLISDLSPLAGLTSLTTLSLDTNQISDISPLVNLTGLTGLGLDDNQISDISPLANLTNLALLSLRNNQIIDISPLVENEGLGGGDRVWLGGNPLSEQSISEYIPALEARGVTVEY